MNFKKQFVLICLMMAGLSLVFQSCNKDDDDPVDPEANYTKYEFSPGANNQTEVQEAMINMSNMSIIEFSAGTFDFTSTLSVEGKDTIIIRGAGRGATTLSFAGQTSGAEGLKITNVNWFLIQDLTVEDTEGDAIKIKDSDGVSMINVGTEWTGPVSEDNGAYGLYPVTCTNVLIDNCYVKGASDAGIYVGQTEKAIVRNSLVEMNVAGIEIENTISADVYDNTAQSNTGGILVFDLPNLAVNGNKTRVYNNTIIRNDHENFAPSGNIVASVPPGTGIMIMSTKQVEIFNNSITNNNILGIGVVSYLALQLFDSNLQIPPDYDPYASGINIHDNTLTNDGVLPTDLNQVGNTILTLYQLDTGGDTLPHVIYDGFIDSTFSGPNEVLCAKNNGTADFYSLGLDDQQTTLTDHDCSPAALPEVVVIAPGI